MSLISKLPYAFIFLSDYEANTLPFWDHGSFVETHIPTALYFSRMFVTYTTSTFAVGNRRYPVALLLPPYRFIVNVADSFGGIRALESGWPVEEEGR